jgi:amino acid transporter
MDIRVSSISNASKESHWSERLPVRLLVLFAVLGLLMQSFASKLPEPLQYLGAAITMVVTLISIVWLVIYVAKEWRSGNRKGLAAETSIAIVALVSAIVLAWYLSNSASKTPEITQINSQVALTPPTVNRQNNQNSSGTNIQGTINGPVTINSVPAPQPSKIQQIAEYCKNRKRSAISIPDSKYMTIINVHVEDVCGCINAEGSTFTYVQNSTCNDSIEAWGKP